MPTVEEIIAFVREQDIAVIASVDADGFPNMKAMLPPREIEGTTIYFSTNTSSMRTEQYRQNPKASLYFFNPAQFTGVMLKGTMEVLEDQATKDRLWREGDTRYYSGGPTDPNYCTLRFTSLEARWYSKMESCTVGMTQ